MKLSMLTWHPMFIISARFAHYTEGWEEVSCILRCLTNQLIPSENAKRALILSAAKESLVTLFENGALPKGTLL